MPFVEGRLRGTPVRATFATECAHCARPMRLEVDSELHCRIEDDLAPLIFIPIVNFAKLESPTIIDAF